jgi:hypothetical protein
MKTKYKILVKRIITRVESVGLEFGADSEEKAEAALLDLTANFTWGQLAHLGQTFAPEEKYKIEVEVLGPAEEEELSPAEVRAVDTERKLVKGGKHETQ